MVAQCSFCSRGLHKRVALVFKRGYMHPSYVYVHKHCTLCTTFFAGQFSAICLHPFPTTFRTLSAAIVSNIVSDDCFGFLLQFQMAACFDQICSRTCERFTLLFFVRRTCKCRVRVHKYLNRTYAISDYSVHHHNTVVIHSIFSLSNTCNTFYRTCIWLTIIMNSSWHWNTSIFLHYNTDAIILYYNTGFVSVYMYMYVNATVVVTWCECRLLQTSRDANVVCSKLHVIL